MTFCLVKKRKKKLAFSCTVTSDLTKSHLAKVIQGRSDFICTDPPITIQPVQTRRPPVAGEMSRILNSYSFQRFDFFFRSMAIRSTQTPNLLVISTRRKCYCGPDQSVTPLGVHLWWVGGQTIISWTIGFLQSEPHNLFPRTTPFPGLTEGCFAPSLTEPLRPLPDAHAFVSFPHSIHWFLDLLPETTQPRRSVRPSAAVTGWGEERFCFRNAR